MEDAAAPAITMHAIEKSFGAVRANRGASLAVRAGEIHALVGENGAGKSTLMRILSGMTDPDSGSIHLFGRDVTGWSAAEAIEAGVGMVHQHFMLVPTLTVAENLVLGREPRRGIAFDLAAAMREVRGLTERTGLRASPESVVADLSVGEAQRVEILRTIFRGARVLILDEPTAVLSPPEIAELWRVLRTLRDGGSTVVLITHKLDEVMDVSDAVTVMRDGRTVTRFATRDTTPATIARAMVGRDVALVSGETVLSSRSPVHMDTVPRGPALEVRDLVAMGARRTRALHGVAFTVNRGEILGMAGVEGNGQTELIETIAGLRPAASGLVLLESHDMKTLGVRERTEAGLAHIPEDRHRRGLVLDFSVADNLILGRQGRFTRRGALDRHAIAAHAMERVEAFDIRPGDPTLPARALSGGNQQKIVIAREMSAPDGSESVVLLAAQPTRGVDVGAIEMIHARLRAARDAGTAVLLVSAELSEILSLSDRVAVMYGGRIVVTMLRADASVELLGGYMTGAHSGGQTTGAA
ncbi:MAG: ABC transporter ATP-binding protein [Gemmatimonadaceae bacterium]